MDNILQVREKVLEYSFGELLIDVKHQVRNIHITATTIFPEYIEIKGKTTKGRTKLTIQRKVAKLNKLGLIP